jgi:hypothetical protein
MRLGKNQLGMGGREGKERERWKPYSGGKDVVID